MFPHLRGTFGRAPEFGAIAQLGERYNGIVEVDGSIPSGSTNQDKGFAGNGEALLVSGSRPEAIGKNLRHDRPPGR